MITFENDLDSDVDSVAELACGNDHIQRQKMLNDCG